MKMTCGALLMATSVAGADIGTLGWMAGSWAGVDGEVAMEELWMPPKGGSMLGLTATWRLGAR